MSTFTASDAIDMSKEKDWAASLGMMDWDSTRIVFTKRTLIEFLKYTGITVDTNYTNISKLPRYAKFGKLTGEEASGAQESSSTSAAASSTPASNDDFRPTRRVRTAPGGATHNIFGGDEDDDALSLAPPRGPTTVTEQNAPTNTIANEPESDRPAFKPSRRVREMPGGRDSIADIL